MLQIISIERIIILPAMSFTDFPLTSIGVNSAQAIL
jgi:hypothetical protein